MKFLISVSWWSVKIPLDSAITRRTIDKMHSQLKWNSGPLCTARSRAVGLVEVWRCAQRELASRPAGFPPQLLHLPAGPRP